MPASNFIDDVRRFLRERLTPAVRVLFVLNVGLFVPYWMFRGAPFWRLFECWSNEVIVKGYLWQTITYSFLHNDPFHLLSNMLFLWFLGPMVEQRIGTSAFYRVYFLAAFVGGLLHGLIFLGSSFPRYLIGASGAVMGISVICAIYYFDVIILFFGVFPIKLGYLIIILLAIDVLYMVGPQSGGIAHYAHLGGAAVGYLYVKLRWNWLDIWRWRARALLSYLWPFGRRTRRRKQPKGRVINIFDDERFKKEK